MQGNSATPQSPQSAVTVSFASAQTAGDLNVVVVGWNDSTRQVSSVNDSAGNAYALAVGPTVVTGMATQSIYYAKSIVGGTDAVTVTFNGAANFPDVRILEYGGLDGTAPLDVAVGSTGNSGTSSSGTAVTTNASDLLVAANYVMTGTTGAGAGFTSRMITVPDSDIVEDRTVTATGSYSATAPLSSSGAWVMQLVAFKAAGGAPPPPDTQPPTAPASLAATAVSSSQINLTWTASTDNVGVTGYLIERCQGAGCSTFAQIGTSPSASFSSTGLAASTSYSYRVRATDAANNLSGYSNVAGATTQAAPTVPTFVQGNYATPQTAQSTVTVSFPSAEGAGDLNVVVVGWNDSTRQVSTVADSAGNAYAVAAGPTVISGTATQVIYYAKNVAGGNAAVTVTFNGAANFPDVRVLEYRGVDGSAPLDVAVGSTGNSGTSSSGNLVTTNAADLLVAANYVMTATSGAGAGFTSRMITVPDSDIVEDRTVTATGSYSATAPLSSSGAWVMQLVAFKAAGTAPPPPDTQPPTAPASLTATAISGSQINLAWTASTDNVGVTGYLVERCQGAGCSSFAQIGTTAGTTFPSTGLTAGTSYSYRVRATDAANNLSGYSNTATAVTTAADTQPPTAPTGLAATATSPSQIALSWTASTDNVGVTGYLIERCQGAGCSTFAQIATSATASFGDSGLAASTSYSYRVRATDAANNLSGYSNVASATTQAASITPVYVQGASASPQSAQTQVAVPFAAAQTAGNLNVVVIGWNNTTSLVSSVSDSAGNAYALAAGPTVLAGVGTQSIYYARNIAAAASNTVTVRFGTAAPFPDMRVLEYRGLDPSAPLDVAVANTGSSSTSFSGTVATTNTVDLLVAGNYILTGTAGAGAGFTSRIITVPDSDIVEDSVTTTLGSYSATAPLTGASGWIMQMAAFKAANSPPPPPPDTTPPTVAVTSPTAGAGLSTTVTVNVSASDNVGVASVQLLVDGVAVGLIDTASPYTFTLDTRQFANGSHTIAANAWDAARNLGTAAPVAVTFTNASPGNPAQTGLWSGTTALPIVSISMALLSSGKLLMWDGQSWGFDSRVWDPVLGTIVSHGTPVNVFCTGLEQMADGRILVIGGHVDAHVGLTAVNAFDPVTESWTVLPDMAFPRWYGTASILPDGRLMALSGETSCDDCFEATPEIYNPSTNAWTQLGSAQHVFSYYPHVFGLSDGRVLVSSTDEQPTASQIFDLNALTWSAVGGATVDGGGAVMYAPNKILKTGASEDPNDAAVPAAATAYVLDMNQPTPTWRSVASMAFARTYHIMTSLPDGNVLVTGGGPTTAATDTAHAVLQPEMWSATAETWTTLAAMHAPRLYHSTALLLPDARVVVAGGGRFDDLTAPTDQFSAEFFSPPYLFKGPRPVIASAPSTLSYGPAFTVGTPDAARIAKVSLVRFGTSTHAMDWSQRFVPLAFTAGSSSLTVTPPANANAAPHGYYMLFLVDTNGVPSVAAIVRL